MDQTIEAVLATLIFFLLISMMNYVSLGLYVSATAREAGAVLNDYSMIVSNIMIIENGNRTASWSLWSPLTDPDAFGLPDGLHVAINASSFHINSNGNATTRWVKSAGSPPLNANAGVCERLVILDDRSAVLVSVVVW